MLLESETNSIEEKVKFGCERRGSDFAGAAERERERRI